MKSNIMPNNLLFYTQIIMENIKLFTKKLRETISNINNTFSVRYNEGHVQLDFKNTLYASAIALNKESIDNVTDTLDIEHITKVSKNAIIKKRNNKKTYEHIRNLNNELLNIVYDSNNKFIDKKVYELDNDKKSYIKSTKKNKTLFINKTNKRILACDAMQLNVNKSLINNNDIKKSSNGLYGVALVSALYDVFLKIPINYQLIKSNEINFNKKRVNETTGFLDQINKLTSNDIILFDRWYFSNELHKFMNAKQIGYVFRMKNNSKLFNLMKIGTSKLTKLNGIDIQLFKYKIKKETYCILTSIIDKMSVNEMKALYWKRWEIETNNRKFKYNILLKNIRSKNYNSFLVDLESIKFMSIISSFIEYIGDKYKSNKIKINSTNSIRILYDKLLILLLYNKKNNCNEICRIIGIIFKRIVPIIKGRKCIRRRVSPSTKWRSKGTEKEYIDNS